MHAKPLGSLASIFLVLALLPSVATAQDSGIAGAVFDNTGGVLPGVTVEASSPALIERSRVAVTDGRGRYSITGLRPGTYTVTFTLLGFSKAVREGIELTAQFTATVDAKLSLGALEETVIVSGESPLVDVQNVREQSVLSREVLDTLPTYRSLGGFTALTVGLSTNATFQDVGGNKGESVFAARIHGSSNGDLRWRQDGMVWNTPLFTGSIRTHRQNIVGVQEAVVEQGGTADRETGGVQINYIPRDGANTFSVYSVSNYTNEDLQGSNLTDDLRARGITTTPGTKEIWDYGIGVGGPILQDRLWFYQSNRWWGGSEYQPGAYFNPNVGSLFFTPDRSRQAWASNWAKDFGGRLTWQAADRHKFTYTHNIQRNCNCVSGVSSIRPPEVTTNSDNYWNHVAQVTWNAPLTNRLLFTAGTSIGLFPQSSHLVFGTTPDTIGIRDLGTGVWYNARSTLGGITDYGEDRRRDTVSGEFSVSYVTGTHAFKAGAQLIQGFQDENSYVPNDVTYLFRNGVPVSLMQWASPLVHRTRTRSVGLYVQDQWTVGQFTINAGLRFDRFRGWTLAENLPPVSSVMALACEESTTQGACREVAVPTGRFVGARSFPQVDDVPNFNDLSPRVSVAYDLFGDGRTALKVAMNRYVEGLGTAFAQSVHPALTIVENTTRTWSDANGNFVPDCDLARAEANGECGAFDNQRFGTSIPGVQRAPEVTEGFGNRGYNWQFLAGIEHELWRGVALSAGYYRTAYGNFTVADNLLVTSDDFDLYCLALPVDSRLPGGGGNEECRFYDVAPDAFGRVDNLVVPASQFGDQREVYNGIDVGLNARFDGILLGGGISVERTGTECVVVDSPQLYRSLARDFFSGTFCDVTPPWSAGTSAKFNAAYPFPWWGLSASVVLQNLPGIPISANYNAPNSVIAPSLGRNLAACPSSTGPCTATASVPLIPPMTLFEDRLTQVDVRFSKSFAAGNGRVRAMFDIYNLFNASTVLSVNNTYGPSWQRPTQIIGPRIAKFGVEVTF